MSMPIANNYSTAAPKNLEELEAMKGTAPKRGGFSIAAGGTQVHGEFAAANNNFANSMNTRGQENECRNMLSVAKSTDGDAKSRTSDSHSLQTGYADDIKQHTNIAQNQAKLAGKYQQNALSISDKQQQIQAWIEASSPDIESLQTQIATIESDAIAQVAELCPDVEIPEGATLGEIAEILNEAMAPVQEELDAKQAEKETLQQQTEGLDPNNPEDQTKLQALNGQISALDADIQGILEGGGFNGMAEAMAVIQDAGAAMAECQDAIANYSETMDAKVNELNGLNDQTQEQISNSKKAQNNVKTESRTITKAQDDSEDDSNSAVEFLEGAANVCNKARTVGTLTKVSGEALAATGYGSAAASGLITIGTWTETAGAIGEASADVGLAVATGDVNYVAEAGMIAGSTLLSAATAASNAGATGAGVLNVGKNVTTNAMNKAADLTKTFDKLTSIGNSLQSIGGGVVNLSGKKYEDGKINNGGNNNSSSNTNTNNKTEEKEKTTTTEKTASGNTTKFPTKDKGTKVEDSGDDENKKEKKVGGAGGANLG